MGIKWGIVGTGNMAQGFVEDFKAVKHGEILAVASRNQSKADEFADRFNIERSYMGYSNLAKDKEIDIVYIATPHTFHYENTMLFLNNDKSVLCEKAFAVNTKQAKEMIDLAKKKELLLMEAMWTYLLPAIKKVQYWIKKGKIGKIRMIKADFGFPANYDPESRLFNPELAGGALLDIGVYNISLANLIMDSKIKNITANAYIGATGVDHNNAIMLESENGIIAQLTSSFENKLENNAYILGSKGEIIIENFWMAKKVILKTKNGTKEIFEDLSKYAGYNHEADEVNRLLMEDKTESDIITLKGSLKTMEIMDEVRKQIGVKYPFE